MFIVSIFFFPFLPSQKKANLLTYHFIPSHHNSLNSLLYHLAAQLQGVLFTRCSLWVALPEARVQKAMYMVPPGVV